MGSHILPSSFELFFCLFFFLFMEITVCQGKKSCSSSCGNLQNISPPLRLRGDPARCGNPYFEFNCVDNHTVLEIPPNKYYVVDISYDDKQITVLDVGLAHGNCSLPDGSLFSGDLGGKPWHIHAFSRATFINCSAKIDSDYESVPCLTKNNSTIYVMLGTQYYIQDLPVNCRFLSSIPVTSNFNNLSTFDNVKLGFSIRWERFSKFTADTIKNCARMVPRDVMSDALWIDTPDAYYYTSSRIKAWATPLAFVISFLDCLEQTSSMSTFAYIAAVAILIILEIGLVVLVLLLIGRVLFAPLCLISFLGYNIYKVLMPVDIIERFLCNQKALSPSRYSYDEIVTITSNFKEKIGQGGFGSVFKGRIPGGYLVAVKILGKSMGDGEDFINEVSTIGRVHHVNVVHLVGFCAEGSYRALIYEYMANGSLDKYIFASNVANRVLTKEKLMDIALSVAKGLHYLHQGCNMSILHFDIKPHNILLDHKFTPKISDFGLAKLHPKDHSLVSISVARGTIGYIAPELVSKSFGSISFKSDVYSFGMLLMDMAGRRRHTDMKVCNSSQVYYPSWIYDMLQKRYVIENIDIIEIDDLERKLSMVGLWCIQTRPLDRPSMIKVIEMLETDVDSLQMPPKPFFSSSDPVPPTVYYRDSSLGALSIVSEDL